MKGTKCTTKKSTKPALVAVTIQNSHKTLEMNYTHTQPLTHAATTITTQIATKPNAKKLKK